MQSIYHKIAQGIQLNHKDTVKMLGVTLGSEHYYKILGLANNYSRKTFNNKSLIFAQIGLDAQACPVNCKFCGLAEENFDKSGTSKKTKEEVVQKVLELVEHGADEAFLMTTASYDPEEYLEMGVEVRKHIPQTMRMVANVGDFDYEYAVKLKEAGFTGVYHIVRLREGIDTDVTVETREKSIEALQKAGLELYYCVEPIGPEHTDEEIADEIMRAVDLHIDVMAVMRRIKIRGTEIYDRGRILAHRLALICAVTVLAVRPRRAMGVHEPEEFSLMAGANQLYAEYGANPRDKSVATEKNRGISIEKAGSMLNETGWEK